jgi:hypothetical protein
LYGVIRTIIKSFLYIYTHQYLYTCIVIVCEHGLRIVICCALSNKELLLLLLLLLKFYFIQRPMTYKYLWDICIDFSYYINLGAVVVMIVW